MALIAWMVTDAEAQSRPREDQGCCHIHLGHGNSCRGHRRLVTSCILHQRLVKFPARQGLQLKNKRLPSWCSPFFTPSDPFQPNVKGDLSGSSLRAESRAENKSLVRYPARCSRKKRFLGCISLAPHGSAVIRPNKPGYYSRSSGPLVLARSFSNALDYVLLLIHSFMNNISKNSPIGCIWIVIKFHLCIIILHNLYPAHIFSQYTTFIGNWSKTGRIHF